MSVVKEDFYDSSQKWLLRLKGRLDGFKITIAKTSMVSLPPVSALPETTLILHDLYRRFHGRRSPISPLPQAVQGPAGF